MRILIRRAIPFAAVLSACGSEVTLLDVPRPPTSELRLILTPEPEDLSVAEGLGWVGRIPNAEVVITPMDSSSQARTLVSDAEGVVEPGPLEAGTYILDVTRWLSDAEQAMIRQSRVDGWLTRQRIRFPRTESELIVPVAANRLRDLMISEWEFNKVARPPVNETYHFGGFIELYNNADTTVFLDGLIIARGLLYGFDYPNFRCSATDAFTNDPQGIWVREVQQFPGQGRDRPVLPGEVVLVVTDAIDHSTIINGGMDLSNADWEFWGGPGDIDNPAVPNMSDALTLGRNGLGHGPVFQDLGSVALLARPYDLATVIRARDPAESEYARVAPDLIVDVVTLWPNYVSTYGPRCAQLVNRRFDRGSFDGRGFNGDAEYEFSVSRRMRPVPNRNQPRMQHTKNSDADLVRTPRSPGTLGEQGSR